MRKSTLVFAILILSILARPVFASKADNIKSCQDKANEYTNISLNELVANYEGNWLSASIVKWENVVCEVKLGHVSNLTINNRSYVYEGFSGEDAYELNTRLEKKTEEAINNLKSRIELLSERMVAATEKLQARNSDLKSIEEYIDKGIGAALEFNDSESNTYLTKPTFITTTKTEPNYKRTEKLDNYYVISEKINVRLAPNINGKVTNTLYKRQEVKVTEIRNGWARISQYYDGSLEGVTGNVARWVFAKHISTDEPDKEKTESTNSQLMKLIRSSDDFLKHKSIFVSSAEKLLNSGQCNLADFKEMGGWWRSTSYATKPVYFMYCGGMTQKNRIYLNTSTGDIFR